MIAPVADCQGFGRRLPGASLLLLLPALFFAVNPELFELRWPSAMGAQVWRLVTGHWTHWSASHLTWNLSSVLLLAAACELDRACGRRRLLATVACAALSISAALWLALPEMSRYRGLSGIASALFTLLAISLFRDGRATGHRARTLVGAGALIAFGSKIVFELLTGNLLFVQPTAGEVPFVPIPLAHAVGGFCGLVIGGLLRRHSVVAPAPRSSLQEKRQEPASATEAGSEDSVVKDHSQVQDSMWGAEDRRAPAASQDLNRISPHLFFLKTFPLLLKVFCRRNWPFAAAKGLLRSPSGLLPRLCGHFPRQKRSRLFPLTFSGRKRPVAAAKSLQGRLSGL